MKTHCPGSCDGIQVELKEAAVQAKKGNCVDRHEHCPQWADLGECDENAEMLKYCSVSCGVCIPDPAEEACKDSHSNCKFWADREECTKNPVWMSANCMVSCKTCDQLKKVESKPNEFQDTQRQTTAFGTLQSIEGAHRDKIVARVLESITYMQSAQVQELPEQIRSNCQNRHELCSFWSVINECSNNAAYMKTNCAPSCLSCHLIDMAQRCPKLGDDVDPALHPGDLNKMFERIVRQAPGNRTLTDIEKQELEASHTPIYTVHVHSRPEPATEISAALDKSMPPWVITFDNFVTADECEAMIQLGYKSEYKRSEDVGEKKFDGTHEGVKSERRTSENAWCSTTKGCRKEEIPTRLHDRMSAVMGIPQENSEDMQLLKYEKGQFYRTHHDYIPHQVDRQCGPRILTFFLYLSDVEAGGGTNFPQLDLTVEPKRGRALLWPSVLDSDPMSKDSRMHHQALEVIEGTKFAANGWIHMYDYVTPQSNGCN
jgi:prolyl 4-hydroxylase